MAEYENKLKWLRNASSAIEANVDGSSTPVEFYYTVPAGDTLDIARLLVYIKDFGTFDADLYGNGAVLTNGIDVKVERAGALPDEDLLDGESIKTNAEWQGLAYDFIYNDIGTGDNVASVRWTFARMGKPLRLEAGDRFVVTVNDNLTVLTAHRFQIQGIAY